MGSDISHNRSDETIEAKVKWFRTLNLSERMEMLCEFTDLALELNPQLPDKKHAQQAKKRIQVVSLDDLIKSKRAAGRDVDLEDVRLLELPDDNE
jgi:hypothetical protein